MIDLRSDTVTKPSEGMRAAMASADVGDDVLEHDPTMAALEERVAAIAGTQAAIWLPTGCMSNLVALMIHLERGDRFFAPRWAHVINYELGTSAWLAGGIPLELDWTHPGVPALADIEAIDPVGPYYALKPALLCLENTHNHAGGSIIPPADYRALVAAAHERQMAVHLDGARLWHAAAALGLEVAALAEGADTVSLCLSKGLGAPMGSVLCSSADNIVAARRLRKMLGGGVRQGGIVAAAGLYALEHELPRIDEDRVRAQRLAAGLRELGYDVATPETNIVMVPVANTAATRESWAAAGVLASAMGTNIRMVTHRDVDDEAIDKALAAIAGA